MHAGTSIKPLYTSSRRFCPYVSHFPYVAKSSDFQLIVIVIFDNTFESIQENAQRWIYGTVLYLLNPRFARLLVRNSLSERNSRYPSAAGCLKVALENIYSWIEPLNPTINVFRETLRRLSMVCLGN
jgi:hypothetical protein